MFEKQTSEKGGIQLLKCHQLYIHFNITFTWCDFDNPKFMENISELHISRPITFSRASHYHSR